MHQLRRDVAYLRLLGVPGDIIVDRLLWSLDGVSDVRDNLQLCAVIICYCLFCMSITIPGNETVHVVFLHLTALFLTVNCC